jgi:cardiolipin synthase A/B
MNKGKRVIWRATKLTLAIFIAGLGFGCATGAKRIRHEIQTNYSANDPEFRQSISHLVGRPLLEGNRVKELINGDEVFPAMLEAVRSARRSITFENWNWRSGKLSSEFVAALSERARAGVKVHVLIDGMGTLLLEQTDLHEMRQAGVEFVKHNCLCLQNLFRVNHRDHRKLMVVDGKVGFIGGVCITDKWLGNAEAPPLWRDTHFQVEGPVVGQMQGIFMQNWLEAKSEVLHGEAYFPLLEHAGSALAQCFGTGPGEGPENARLVFLYSIAAARKTIRLAQSYFVPDNLAIEMLIAARKRGVKVEVITPGIIDLNLVRRASRSRWAKLLKAGVEFYEYQPARYHCKVMIVDDLWTTVGSVNFDDRSFRINDEANLNVLDKDFAEAQIKVFELDKSKSRQMTSADYQKRPCHIKLLENLAGLFRSQL